MAIIIALLVTEPNETYTINIPKDKLKIIDSALRIAAKAQDHNPSPVDIKQELAQLNLPAIRELRVEIQKLIG